jgi:hypothetical protein
MTPRINLLPHREARRELKKKVFWVMTACRPWPAC